MEEGLDVSIVCTQHMQCSASWESVKAWLWSIAMLLLIKLHVLYSTALRSRDRDDNALVLQHEGRPCG